MYKTYVYETVDGQYSYINVISTTVNYGVTRWRNIVKGSGIVESKEDIIEVAEEFGSCGFVLYAGDSVNNHTVDEFLEG